MNCGCIIMGWWFCWGGIYCWLFEKFLYFIWGVLGGMKIGWLYGIWVGEFILLYVIGVCFIWGEVKDCDEFDGIMWWLLLLKGGCGLGLCWLLCICIWFICGDWCIFILWVFCCRWKGNWCWCGICGMVCCGFGVVREGLEKGWCLKCFLYVKCIVDLVFLLFCSCFYVGSVL